MPIRLKWLTGPLTAFVCASLMVGCGSPQRETNGIGRQAGGGIGAATSSSSPGSVEPPSPSAEPATPVPTTPATTTTTPATTRRSSAAAVRGVWQGTVDETLDYYAPCGTNFDWVQIGTQSFRHGVRVVASAPLDNDSNTFQLSVATTTQTTEGGLSIVSSGRFNTSSGPVTLAYWTLRVVNGKVTGRLVSTHVAEGVAQNLLYTNKTLDPCGNRLGSIMFPLAMDVGTTISGTLGPGTGTLTVTGRTTDLLRGYRLTFTLDRVG